MSNLNEQIAKVNEQIKQLQNKKKTLLAREIEIALPKELLASNKSTRGWITRGRQAVG
ncbi:MAG: hypothetical protein IJ460_06300 [Clostridia bacterium]|nr:hypothetical protein [Clostridia bacterium]